MAKTFESNSRKIKLPKSGHEMEEFGGGKKGIAVCEVCKAVYYKKSWHHSLLNLKSVKEDAPVKFVLCPACQMIKNRQYEGIVTIKNTPEKLEPELLNLIRGFCERAYEDDCQHRLVAIVESKKGQGTRNLTATVTENELANKLAKKIKETFKNVKTKTAFSKDPSDVARAVVEFLEK